MKEENTEPYTPGPWIVETGLKSPHWISAGNRDLALVLSAVPGTREILPRDANARLIAAAPDLLEALKDILQRFEDLLGPSGNGEIAGDAEAITQARASLAKAKGLTL